MRSYVGVAIDPDTFSEVGEPMSLEVQGFQEIDLGEDKLTLMMLGWTPDEPPFGLAVSRFIELMGKEVDNTG